MPLTGHLRLEQPLHSGACTSRSSCVVSADRALNSPNGVKALDPEVRLGLRVAGHLDEDATPATAQPSAVLLTRAAYIEIGLTQSHRGQVQSP